MEVVQQSNVKIPNSVMVSGLSGTEADEELFDFLKQYGSIQRIIPVNTPGTDRGKQVIVEYVHGTAVQSLSSLLPHKVLSKTLTDVLYLIEALPAVYTPVVSKTATQTYLAELRDIAKQTGKDFATVLREELTSIGKAVDSDNTDTQAEHMEPDLPDTPDSHVPVAAVQVSSQPCGAPEQQIQPPGWSWSPPPVPSEKRATALSFADVSPPELQKVIVEHIVRTEDAATQMMHNSPRLRPFSGRCPRPSNEVDYETWRSNVELLLKDTRQPDLQKARRLLESLSSPAIDIVKHLTFESPPSVYLEILDSAYGTVEDGDDLFAKYLNTMQNHGEEPSTYLQRLQVMLNTTFRRGGVGAGDLDRQLLKQFIRGCWDNHLIAELQLEQKKQNPPTFAGLLLLLRTAEDKRASKASRMKQHLSASRPRVLSHYQGVAPCSLETYPPSLSVDHSTPEIQQIKKQIADLQSQLTRFTQKSSERAEKTQSLKLKAPNSTTVKPPLDSSRLHKIQAPDQVTNNSRNRPKAWYCFRCGEDGHIKPQCESGPNPSLVALKRRQLKERQLAWDTRKGITDCDTLN
ncbi:zinc finger CCHC domain-containing protein 12-like [Archocentrus centrarchus]|uniref:zinc finger CCHC domain-containing protein 12-like n=1 Tax=Archocentrus centrarchus TaxID=63155 RepID=UPI0011EA2628|nr:zinc finger CCHC domain-containing protein 12-like [Archocentrus centrarchus]